MGWIVGALSGAVLAGAGLDYVVPAEKAERVTLVQREDNAAYGKCAYSFRHASQDLDEHGNEVDLVFDVCGSIHVSDGGATNRVVRVEGKKLDDVTAIPADGWMTNCFAPEKSAIYVMQIEDADEKFAVKFRVTDAKRDKVVLEWLPLRIKPQTALGTRGACGGPHDCK